ncbi:LGFP repeat-containing protein [Kitasatospora sp. NPDC058190]|uniref:LGFP repeat-containing protein n=1 Tax=Kitasatospora sp. NPDC058190 TaxID=3346371 RepID=UPI0036DA5B10
MQGSTAGQLAQAVQRSAYPDRYDQAEGIARAQRDKAFQPYGTTGAEYAAMGGAGSVLGLPVRAESDASLGGRFQQFRNGILLWHPDEAHLVYGDVLTTFWNTDAERHWGFPTTDDVDENDGRAQHFRNAVIHWSPTRGTWITR